MDMVAEQPVKKRKQRQRVKYLDIQVPEAKDERRAALQKLYERERCLQKLCKILWQSTFGGTRVCFSFQLEAARNEEKERSEEESVSAKNM